MFENMVSVEQISVLIDRMERHPFIALGQSNRSKEGRTVSRRFWVECARVLNKVSPDCCTKTPDQWRLYYNEYKCKVLKKVKIEKGKTIAAGGGLCKIPLTPLQKRLYTILKSDVAEPKPVRDPLFQYQVLKSEVPDDAATGNIPVEDVSHNESPEQASQPSSSKSELTMMLPVTEPERESQRSSSEEELPQPSPPPAPRRRRRRRSLLINAAEHKRARREISEHYRARLDADEKWSMHEATKRLENLERMTAAATREHARATNRLAAALEAIAERLRDPITVTVNQRTSETQSQDPNETRRQPSETHRQDDSATKRARRVSSSEHNTDKHHSNTIFCE
ncbi:uncharacterized protein LOC128683426 [Plodia interpunctella]|uniref:uncharacterized protein LOC128683426 n=1 Tax=Plodia interpunctella TaxID=58824 RepID=UPI0023687E17|nr:uncharacterized protein LOC128683426 [Plodia interpunctella]